MSRITELNVRSGPSRKSAYLRFINRTSKHVNIFWIDFEGYARSYGTLHPHREFDVHSFVTHPWVCEDWLTKTRLLLNKSEIFYPTSTSDENGNNDSSRYLLQAIRDDEPCGERGIYDNYRIKIIKREYVHITLPVFPLLQISAEVIVKNVRNVEDINTFEIPTQLKTLLQTHYSHCL